MQSDSVNVSTQQPLPVLVLKVLRGPEGDPPVVPRGTVDGLVDRGVALNPVQARPVSHELESRQVVLEQQVAQVQIVFAIQDV